ncbi:hypothetical protein EA58_12210 [Photobacterium galatheae]|uniref:Uncharacterized protein n=1 Tax=Photobacterium galatheae TaxID=1654360 RepID=A0A066RUF4_9GAMM|nr:hypothetical protein EA58_12210 [Photobacterium galatheae]
MRVGKVGAIGAYINTETRLVSARNRATAEPTGFRCVEGSLYHCAGLRGSAETLQGYKDNYNNDDKNNFQLATFGWLSFLTCCALWADQLSSFLHAEDAGIQCIVLFLSAVTMTVQAWL